MQKVSYYNPIDGLTKGTKQGLVVCGLLLVPLLVFSMVDVGVTNRLTKTLDLICGLLVAIAATFVVGGTFRIEGKWYDFGVKAGGGAALLIFVTFWLQPYSKMQSPPEWPISVKLAPYACLGEIIDQVSDERARKVHNYTFDFNKQEGEIRKFRPIPPHAERTYNGKAWLDIFEDFEQDAPCFQVTTITPNVISLNLDVSNTIEKQFKKADGSTAVLCLCK